MQKYRKMQHLIVKKSNSFALNILNNHKPKNPMKKVSSLLIAAGMVALISCGPSAEEKAATEKAVQDSINTAMQKITSDSMAAVQAEQARMDSLNAVMMQAQQDSIDAANKKAANKPKPKVKPKAEVKAPEGAPKVGNKKPGSK